MKKTSRKKLVLFLKFRLNGSGNLAASEATGTNINGFMSSFNDCVNLSDIGFPSSVGFSVGVGNVVSKGNAFAAIHTFCHILHLRGFFNNVNFTGESPAVDRVSI